ncbi:glycosyltransferase family 4 protein [Indiicoccus explosivorum]|uniref:glycosyltransferase family 4 protein n=1 Tax=Indiicoccus explosivorum TaxID=1917864 RepID=UPI000B43B9E3|nr:glycosyltransferase family 4 protein [Indiicoccus explosivorum]
MNILLVSNMYPSEQFPSYGIFVKNTESILENAGFSVDRAVIRKRTGKRQKAAAYASHYASVIRKGLSGKYDAIYVHYAAHNALPLLMLKRLKPSVRIVTNVHGSDVVPEVPSQEKFQPAVRQLLERSAVIVTPSGYYRDLVREKYGVDTPIRVFPSGGVNTAVFHPEEEGRGAWLEEFGLDASLRYFGYVGRMDVGKGWDHCLKGFAAFLEANPDERGRTRLIMVGSGQEEDGFRLLKSELGLDDDVIHFPLMKQRDLAKIYNIIDLFIFPTTRKGESLGLVGLEAMACGTPIAASRIGGILDYTEDGVNGWLFEPGNAQELAERLTAFSRLSPGEQQRAGQAALETSKAYDQDAIGPKLAAIFRELGPST